MISTVYNVSKVEIKRITWPTEDGSVVKVEMHIFSDDGFDCINLLPECGKPIEVDDGE